MTFMVLKSDLSLVLAKVRISSYCIFTKTEGSVNTLPSVLYKPSCLKYAKGLNHDHAVPRVRNLQSSIRQ